MRKKFLLMFLVLSLFTSMEGGHLFAQNGDVEISTVSEFKAFAESVNGGTSYEGQTVTLTSDLNLSGEWTPIGNGSRSSKTYTGNSFKGTFDGGDHAISGLTITSTSGADAAVGLFGIVDGGKVKNLNLTDVNINVPSSKLAGAAIGMMLNNATAANITVSGAIVGNDGVGGIVGRMIINGTIANCTNNASVTTSYGGIGGIVGKPYYDNASNTSDFATITNCINNGTITAGSYAGGIAGLARANVTDCVNNGEIKGGTQTGGIIGQLIAAGTVSGNENKGKVSGTNHVGGIIGSYTQSNDYSYYDVTIANNINRGEIAATQQCAAILGVNNIDGFTAMTATGNVSYYYVEGLEMFGNPEDMVIEATNEFIIEAADFATFKTAVEAGINVTLTADITTTAAITTSGVSSVVDLNGKTLTIGAGDNQFNDESNITIKNGDINITGVTVGGNAIFRLDEYEKTLVTTMTLENVNLIGNGYSSAYGIFYIGDSSVLNVIGGEWDLKNDTFTDGGVFKADASAATLNIEGTKITAHNVRRFVTYAATEINNATIVLSGDADEVDAEMEHGFNRSPLAISNSTITMTDMVGRGITAEKGAVTIENSSVTMTNVQEATIDVRGNQTVTIDSESTVTLDKEPTVNSGTITGNVTVDAGVGKVAKVGETYYKSLQEAIDAIKNMDGEVNITLLDDATLDITAWQTLAIGGENTTKITIDGDNGDNDFTLTFNKLNSDWNNVATKNNATLVLKNMTITDSGYNNGPWNRYDLNFACNTELVNVNATKALAFKAGATLNNVTINETGDNYAIWIQPNGQVIAIDELVIESAGRGIKIDDQYVGNPALVVLEIKNAEFTTAKKSAILVKSPTGANITAENVNIENVAADKNNLVWVDSDGAANYGNVTVTGGTIAQEDAEEFKVAIKDNNDNVKGYYKSLQAAINAAVNGDVVTLLADNAENVTVTQKPDVKFTIDGADKTMTGTITIDGKSAAYATAGITVKNMNFTAATEAVCINLGVSGNNNTRYTSNVTVESCNFTGTDKTAAGIKSYTGGDKNLIVKDCTATGMHSLMQLKNTAGVSVTECEITESKNGISLGASSDVAINKTTVDCAGYGVRADANGDNGNATITDCTIEAFIPVVVRNASKDYALKFNGENNTMTATNEDGLWCAIGTSEYETNGQLPTAPTGDVTVTLNDTGLSMDGVYGEHFALNGEGTAESPYLINNLYELKGFRDQVNAGNNYAGKYIQLNADIDMAGVEWTPIGNVTYDDSKYMPADASKVFSGEFNGNGKVISNLKVASTVGGVDKQANVGLFGITGEGADIKDLTLTNVNIETDGRNVGALAGFAYKATLSNITVNGNIQIKGGNNVAGVAGMTRYYDMSATNISVSGANGSAIVGNNIVGGIFAEIAPNGSKQKFDGLNVENVAITGVGGVGGIVGLLTTGTVENVSVKNVALTGRTDYQGNAMGRIRLGSVAGLMGGKYATIANVTTENVTAKNLDGNAVVLPIIGANYDASSNATEAKIGDTYYATLQAALNAAVAGTGNITVEILEDIDLTNVDWNPVTVSAPGYPVVTVEGNGKTIKGLNDMLFAGTWAGGSGLIINNLTIANSNIVNDKDDAKGTVGVGAFIGFPQASATITLHNCHLKNSTVEGGHWTGGLIGYAAGYAGNDGPVFMNLTIKDCSVTESTITGKGSVGGIIGHGSGNAWTNVVIEGTTVSNNTITSTGSSNVKAGAVMGTIGAAGQPTTVNGVTHTGGMSVSATVADNTVKSNGTEITTIYGRQGTETGMLYVAGGTYDKYPIEEGVTYAAPAAGYKIEQNTDGTYGVVVDPAYGKVAKIGDVYYATIADAIAAAQTDDVVTLIRDITTSAQININKNVAIDGCDKKLTVNAARGFQITGGTVAISNMTIDMPNAAEGNRGINLYNGDSNAALDVTLTNVTINGGKAYAVNIGGGKDNKLTINGSTLTGYAAINVHTSSVNHTIVVDGSTLNGKNHNDNYDFGTVVIDGTNAHSLTITNTTITTENLEGVDSNYEKVIVGPNCTLVWDGDAAVRNILADSKGGKLYYTDLQAAINDAAEVSGTVQILGNITTTTSVVVPANKKITLDLNGKTITSSDITVTVDGGELTVVDDTEAKDGKIISTHATGNEAVAVMNGGKFTLESGNIEGASYGVYLYPSGGTGIINGGTITLGGDYKDGMTVAVANDKCSLTVTGGTFTANGVNYPMYTWGGTIELKGGMFDFNPNLDYIAKGYAAEAVADMDGWFRVVAVEPMIAIQGGESFYTLSDAFAAAKENDVISISKAGEYIWPNTAIPADVTVKGTVEGVVVDGNRTIINATTLTVENIDFTAINEAVYITNGKASNITFTDCSFTGNYSLLVDSAAKNSVFTFNNCVFNSFTTFAGSVGEVNVNGGKINHRFVVRQDATLTEVVISEVDAAGIQIGTTDVVTNINVNMNGCTVEDTNGDGTTPNINDLVVENNVADDKGNTVVVDDVIIYGGVAMIGETRYVTLQDAIDAASQENETINLLCNVDLTEPLTISGKTLILNLGDYTIFDKSTKVLTNNDNVLGLIDVKNGAKLTVNGDDNGTIKCNYTNVTGGWTGMAYAINVDATSELTVNSGNFINGNGGIQTLGKVTVNGGEFITHNGGTCIMALYDDAEVTVNDGTFEDSVEENDVYSGSGAVWSGFGATVEIKGGTYDFAADPENGNVVWTLFPAQHAIAGMTSYDINMTVSGGTFRNFNPEEDVIVDYSSTAGFTFGSVVAEGYVCKYDETTDTYSVVKAKAKVAETNVAYASLTEAVAAAVPEQTIVLLADTEEDVTFDKALTLDGNNKQFKYTGKITLPNADFTVKNTAFVDGYLYKNESNSLSGGNYTITGCTFVSNNKLEYPIHIYMSNSINITYCTLTGYQRFLYVFKTNSGVSVNGVESEGTSSAAITINSDSDITLENVTMEGTGPFLNFSKSYAKNNTVTIKDGNIIAQNGNLVVNSADKTNKIVFEGVTELNQNVFTGSYDLRDKVTVVAEAQIGTRVYGTLSDAIAAAVETETINVINPVVVTEDKVYNIAGKTIVGNEVYPVIRIQNGADVTVTGEGSITNNDYVFVLGASDETSAGSLTIAGGTFTGTTTVASVTKGELTIEGGAFSVNESEYGAIYMINCIDANYNNESAVVSISGGTFHGFNPQANAAEGAGTNFCAEGYAATEIEENVWQVLPAKAMIAETSVAYVSLTEAVAAAVPEQTIVLLADTEEDVTFDKALTLDGNNKQFKYTGKITLPNADFTVKNTAFVDGYLYKNESNSLSGGNYTITGCTFVSNNKLEYPIHIYMSNSINITYCTLTGYQRFLYVFKTNSGVSVNGVESEGTSSAAITINSDSDITLENVTMEGTGPFLNFSKSYAKNNTVTIKDGNIIAQNGNLVVNSADKTNKIVFEGVTELNQNVFTGSYDLRDKVTVVAEAQIGTRVYGTLSDAIAAAVETETINVINPVVVTEDKVYNIAGKTIVGNEVYPVIRIQNGADVTVTGEGSITNNDYVFVLGASDETSAGSLTIAGGTFTGTTTVASVTKGELTIEGGAFSVNESEYGAIYMINCIDANYNNESAVVSISGGTFYGFNPQANAAEGANTNFCAEGFGAKKITDNVWQVLPMQTTQLSAGWNWFSAYVETDLASLQSALVENLECEEEEENCNIAIKDHYIGTITYYPQIGGWYGNDYFTSFEHEKMYMIQTPTNMNLQIVGEVVNPEEHQITIVQNWNMIGYVLDYSMNLENALASINPVDGDYIKSQHGYAEYLEGIGWYGPLSSMEPGHGYKFLNKENYNRTLKYPTTRSNSKSELRANITTDGNYWTPNASQYPNNMTMTAMVDIEGGDYEVAAFVDGEVRGSARPIYVEPIDAYVLFLTIHGEGVEEMTFKFYDLTTGEEFDLNDRMNYSDDAIVGSLKEPYMFKRGTTGIGETAMSEVNIYPNPTTTGKEINLQATCDKVEVFNALGVKVAEYQNVDSIDALETAGIYVIRITNDSNVQNCRLVVK